MSLRSTLSFSGFLARKFLVSRESDGFLSLISGVSVAGIALGVLALTTVTSVMNGFEGELSRVITGVNGDVILYSRGEPIKEPALAEAKLRKALAERVIAVTPSMVIELMASGAGGVSGALLEGIDPGTVGLVTEIPSKITQGRMPEKDGEVVLGSVVAEKLGLILGGELRLIVPFAGSGEGGEAKAVDAHVVGIAKMGMYEYDSKFILATLPFAQSVAGVAGAATHFKIKLAPGADAQEASDRLAEYFGYPFRAKAWAQLNRNLFYAVKLEKVVISIILLAIILVAAFNVVSTLMMMIHDKTKEIAILKAMGMLPIQGFALFNSIGLGMGIVGTAIGVILGLLLNRLLERSGLLNLPPEIYYIQGWPIIVKRPELAVIAGSAVLISLLATLYPAWKVATRPPLEGIRYE